MGYEGALCLNTDNSYCNMPSLPPENVLLNQEGVLKPWKYASLVLFMYLSFFNIGDVFKFSIIVECLRTVKYRQ